MKKTTGNIGVTTDNIFPIIKKFLYSDNEIFLRELVSNAIDATTKLQALSRKGEATGELGDLTVHVSLDEKKKTITISDRGIGMTEEEVNKYINQIAFSGAEEFMEKYKDQNIIGHFGLGFYSAFMVSDKVEIITKSYQEGSKAVHWTCNGDPNFTIEEAKKEDRGTDIILHISDDCKEYASKAKISELLKKYCSFLPTAIAFGKKEEWKEGKQVETEEDNIINDTTPLWTVKPSEIKPEQYDEFYHKLYPMASDPLFNIHLNVDYPFNLTGILYFPKLNTQMDFQKNKIQLYCNQVFVTDSVEGIVPDFLTLLHGVIDSPDIPLNVSRSYLQSDTNVKKISSHITKKVADRLADIFKNSREEYEKKWDDLKIFIEYGAISDEKFSERVSEFALFKNTEGKYFTFDEYTELIKGTQTDKNNKIVHLYTNDPIKHFTQIESAKAKGYDVLVMDTIIEGHYISMLEEKHSDWSFARIDADVIDKLIDKNENHTMALSSDDQAILSPAIEAVAPSDDKMHFNVEYSAGAETDYPIMVTRNEWMRRMKEMSQTNGGMSFYGSMPDSFALAVNANHPIIISALKAVKDAAGEDLVKADENIAKAKSEKSSFDTLVKDKKEADLSQEEKDKRKEVTEAVSSAEAARKDILSKVGKENATISQLVDLALLESGLLQGEKLAEFVKRSITFIK